MLYISPRSIGEDLECDQDRERHVGDVEEVGGLDVGAVFTRHIAWHEDYHAVQDGSRPVETNLPVTLPVRRSSTADTMLNQIGTNFKI